jgi:UDP-3-O-[3-hydroxymyristoyl] N-acetylglucosamine deacetylase
LRLRKQRTLKNSIRCAGIGLPPSRGLPALWKNAKVSGDSSNLEMTGGPRVGGVAQLLSAAAAAGVDNLTIELKGPEVPILDGSAEPFLFLLSCYACLEPHDGYAIDIEVDYPHPALGHQQWSGEITIDRYQSEIARARAFEFRAESEGSPGDQPNSGGAMDHAVVIGRDGVLNAGGFRYSDEPVRHTVLSAIGDLHMAGGPIIGRFRGHGGRTDNRPISRARMRSRPSLAAAARAVRDAAGLGVGWRSEERGLAPIMPASEACRRACAHL